MAGALIDDGFEHLRQVQHIFFLQDSRRFFGGANIKLTTVVRSNLVDDVRPYLIAAVGKRGVGRRHIHNANAVGAQNHRRCERQIGRDAHFVRIGSNIFKIQLAG